MEKMACFGTIWFLDGVAEMIEVLRVERQRQIAIYTFMAIDLEDLRSNSDR